MSLNRIPVYHDSKHVAIVQISTANTNRDGSGTLGTVLTAANNGYAVTKVDVIGTVTTTAGQVRLFVDDGGGTARLIAEIAISAATPSASVQCATGSWTPSGDGLCLPSGYILKASTHNAEAINVIAHYGKY